MLLFFATITIPLLANAYYEIRKSTLSANLVLAMKTAVLFLLSSQTAVWGFAPPVPPPSIQCTSRSVAVGSTVPLIFQRSRSVVDPQRTHEGKKHLGYDATPALRTFSSTTTITRLHVTSPATPDQTIAWTSMGLLAIQFGAMPTLQRKCVPRKLCRSSMVLAQEVSKFGLAATCFGLLLSPSQRQQALASWSVQSWWKWAGIPAALYAIQNYAKLLAYQHLSPVAYSVLNQTKTLSTALFCFLLLGIPQSPLQMVSLLVLLSSALVMEQVIPVRRRVAPVPLRIRVSSSLHWKRRSILPHHGAIRGRSRSSKLFSCVTSEHAQQGSRSIVQSRPPPSPQATTASGDAESQRADPRRFTHGVLPLLLANLTSGLAAALGQKALSQQRRNLYLYGMELSSASFLLVLASLLGSQDGRQIRREGWRRHWTAWVWLPIAAHAVGGLLVGLVTKYAGSVQKGFALIFGVLLSGIFQEQWLHHEPVTREQVVGAALACISVWMHAAFPPTAQ